MHPALIVMAILGCGDGGDQCQRVGTAPASYTSIAQCNAAAEVELQKMTGLAYPVIAAKCEAGPRPVQIASAGR